MNVVFSLFLIDLSTQELRVGVVEQKYPHCATIEMVSFYGAILHRQHNLACPFIAFSGYN